MNDMWVLWVWYTPSFHTTEQGLVGTLTMVWYNTYTKKPLYCIEFREGYTIHPIHVCVTGFSLNAWREVEVGGGGYGHTTTSDDTSNIPWEAAASGEASHFTIIFLSIFSVSYFSFYYYPCPKNNTEFVSAPRVFCTLLQIYPNSSASHPKWPHVTTQIFKYISTFNFKI